MSYRTSIFPWEALTLEDASGDDVAVGIPAWKFAVVQPVLSRWNGCPPSWQKCKFPSPGKAAKSAGYFCGLCSSPHNWTYKFSSGKSLFIVQQYWIFSFIWGNRGVRNLPLLLLWWCRVTTLKTKGFSLQLYTALPNILFFSASWEWLVPSCIRAAVPYICPRYKVHEKGGLLLGL